MTLLTQVNAGTSDEILHCLGDQFLVSASADPAIVSCGVAWSHADRIARRQLVADLYVKRGYISPEQVGDDGYVDMYEPISVPLVAKVQGVVVASLRLIANLPTIGLPMYNDPVIVLCDAWRERARIASFEISQLAKADLYKRDHRPTLGLIRTYVAIARHSSRLSSVAVADDHVKQFLNGRLMPHGLIEIGASTLYMGTCSTPVFIDVRHVVRCAREGRQPGLGAFLDTGKGIDYLWYDGP